MTATTDAPAIVKPSVAASSPRAHLDYLDGLRAVAALYVVVHHAFEQLGTQLAQPLPVRAVALFFREGRYAVDLFIVISGFCLTLPVVRSGRLPKGATDFLARRARRILPAYYLALGLSLFLIFTVIGQKTGTLWDVSLPVTDKDVFTHLLLVQDVFHDTLYKINHTFWSISVEWHIYFLFPFLVFCRRRVGPLATVLFTIGLSLTLWFALRRTALNVYGMSPHYVALFAFGMLAAEATGKSRTQPLRWMIVILAAVAAMLVHPILIGDFTVGLLSALLLTVLVREQAPWLRKAFAWKPLVFTGTFAYSIYLIHAPLLQLVSQYVIGPLRLPPLVSLLVLLFAGVPVILSCCYLFYLAAERPFLKRAKAVKFQEQPS